MVGKLRTNVPASLYTTFSFLFFTTHMGPLGLIKAGLIGFLNTLAFKLEPLENVWFNGKSVICDFQHSKRKENFISSLTFYPEEICSAVFPKRFGFLHFFLNQGDANNEKTSRKFFFMISVLYLLKLENLGSGKVRYYILFFSSLILTSFFNLFFTEFQKSWFCFLNFKRR